MGFWAGEQGQTGTTEAPTLNPWQQLGGKVGGVHSRFDALTGLTLWSAHGA